MTVLVFDGLLFSMLLGLDYLVATDASVRPAQYPNFLSFPDNPSREPLVLRPIRISRRLQLDAAIFSATVFLPLVGPGLPIWKSSNIPESDPVEVSALLPDEYRLDTPSAGKKTPLKPVDVMTMPEFLHHIMLTVKTTIPSERAALQLLFSEFKDAFATQLEDIKLPSNLPEFSLSTISEDPSLLGSRYKKKFPEAERTVIEQTTERWLANNIVEPCLHRSPVINNLMTVLKADGSHRVCIDATVINKATPLNATFTPDMREILERLVGSQYISVFDLFSGYLQVSFRPEDRHKLAFSTRLGVFQPTRLFFGSKNACAAFCLGILRMEMDSNLSDFLAAYFDDLTVHSLSFSDHLAHLRKFLEAIVKYRLKINLSKSVVAAKEVKALGVLVSAEGIRPTPQDVEAILHMQTPTSRSEVKTLLGFVGHHRSFIPSYAEMTACLCDLTADGPRSSFKWETCHEEAFSAIKSAMSSCPVLALPQLSKPFILYSDASLNGIGGVVAQVQPVPPIQSTTPNGKPPVSTQKPIAFYSRKLTPAEKNYSVTELELLAIVFLVSKSRHWLVGRTTTVVTDHEALQYLLAAPELKSRLVRWKLALNQFDLEIVFRKGILNVEGADALSRLPCTPPGPSGVVPPQAVATAAFLSTYRALDVQGSDLQAEIPPRESRALVVQLNTPPVPSFVFRDPFHNSNLLSLIQNSQSTVLPASVATLSAALIRKLKTIASNYKWEAGMLFFKRDSEEVWLWVPIINQRPTFVARAHLLGHFGQSSTLSRLVQAFKVWWPAIQEDVARCIATCAACITRLPTAPIHHPAVALPIPGIFHRVSMDLALGLPKTSRGSVGVLCIMEYLTKFPVLYPITSKSADEIARHFLNYLCMFGPPAEILTDQGGEFVNSVLSSLCTNLGIEKRLTSSYSPATNGMVERWNRTFIRSLETHAADHPEDWDLYLPYVAFAYRTRVHSVTGTSPFELLFGRPANLFSTAHPVLSADSCVPESLLLRSEEIRQQFEGTIPKTVNIIQKHQELQIQTQDKAVEVRIDPLSLDAVVYCVNCHHQKKMQSRFLGPYRVYEITSAGLYKLKNRHNVVLKKAFPLDQLKVIAPEFAEEIWQAELSQVFAVDSIIYHRFESPSRGIEYLVSWKGYDHDHDSWVRATDILDHELIATYESLPPRPPQGSSGPTMDPPSA